MANDEPTDEGLPQSRFSPELTRAIAQALGDYLRTYGSGSDQTLQELTNRVCTEAKLLGLPPEKMLIEIKQLFEGLPLPELPHSERRRQTFERFISGCIESYFSADEA
jgi:hypothetical protein